MSRGLVIALCALTSSACLREPKFNGTGGPRDADGDAPDGDGSMTTEPEVSALVNGGVAVINGRNFRMQFAAGGGHFPDSLTIGGTEMLGQGASCNAERRLGLALFPSLLINDEMQTGATAQEPPTVPTGLAGPLVAQVRVPFSHMVMCTDGPLMVSGTTTFTGFPDGRIVRHDDLDIAGNLSSMNCPTCTGGTVTTNFYLTTFATIRANAGNSVTGFDVSALTTVGSEMTAANADTFCTDYSQRQLAIAFFTPGGDPQGARIRMVNDTPARTLAFVHDILRSVTGVDSTASRDLSTTMVFSQNGSCAANAARAEALRGRPLLSIGPQNFPLGVNGIYCSSSLAAIGIAPGPFDIKPVGTEIPGGFAVWIELGTQQPATAVMVEHSNASKMTGEWFRRQVPSADQIILYFRDPLAPGETITVRPPPAT